MRLSWHITLIAAAMFIDSIFLPAGFGIYGTKFSLILLVSLIMCWKIDSKLVLWGLFIAFIMESFFYLPFGSIMISWLLAALVYLGLSRIISIKPYFQSPV